QWASTCGDERRGATREHHITRFPHRPVCPRWRLQAPRRFGFLHARLTTIWTDAVYRSKELAEWCQPQGTGWISRSWTESLRSRGCSIQPRRWGVERSPAWFFRNRGMRKHCERNVQSKIAVAAVRLLLRRVGRAR